MVSVFEVVVGIAAIIELFHLLPAAAGKFLDQLVTLTMQLEAALPASQVYSELNSPYRLPLTKFLNRYASDAVDYFLGRLTQPTVFRRYGLTLILCELFVFYVLSICSFYFSNV